MSAPMKISKTIAVGAILAASVGCASTAPKPNSQISIAANAPTAVKSAYSSWVGGGSLSKDAKEHCYGISLKGENDCGASASTSCKGAKGAKADCKAGAGSSCKGKMASGDCKAGAGSSCKGDKGAKADCKASAGITCRGNATVDWQGDAWLYTPKGSCEYIVTPNGRGSLTPK